MHKDDKADTAAVVCKPTITYYDPHRPGDRVVNESHFDKFEKDLENAPFKCNIDTLHETLHFHVPLTLHAGIK